MQRPDLPDAGEAPLIDARSILAPFHMLDGILAEAHRIMPKCHRQFVVDDMVMRMGIEAEGAA